MSETKNVDIILDSASKELNSVGNNPTQLVPASSKIDADPSDALVKITQGEDEDHSRRIHRTTFQARLGRKLDNVHRRVLDNNLRLSANPTDMIRIEVKRDDISRDIMSRTVVAGEVIPVILPSMKSVPLRHFQGMRDGNEVTIPSLYTINENEYFEIYAPVNVKLNPDDLLVRLIYDDVNCPDDPYVMILQVTEQLATIGYSSIRYYQYWCTFYNEQLPQKVIDLIKEANKKRDVLGF